MLYKKNTTEINYLLGICLSEMNKMKVKPINKSSCKSCNKSYVS